MPSLCLTALSTRSCYYSTFCYDFSLLRKRKLCATQLLGGFH